MFGRDPEDLECTVMNEYATPIPNVLVVLKQALFRYQGHLEEGIFRIGPKRSNMEKVKEEIDNGMIDDIDWEQVDVKVIAALIKRFYREMPSKVFAHLNLEALHTVETVSAALDVMNTLSEPEKSYFEWYLDLAVDIGKYADSNLMNGDNLAVVLTPNLYDLVKVKTTTTQSIVQFVSLCIEGRVDSNHLKDAKKIMNDVHGNDIGSDNVSMDSEAAPKVPL